MRAATSISVTACPSARACAGTTSRSFRTSSTGSGCGSRSTAPSGAPRGRLCAASRSAPGRRIDGTLDAGDLAALRRVVGAGGWGTLKKSTPEPPPPLPAGSRARVNSDGLASVADDAPDEVKAIIAAGNEIATKPYRYGGGHGRWNDTGYDCSGSISYALHGAGLIERARDSSEFERFGESGAGQWVTIYANSGHAYMVVAGLRFDTSGRSRSGSRWQTARRSSSGYVVRHPQGL